jgi:hypothetical protein
MDVNYYNTSMTREEILKKMSVDIGDGTPERIRIGEAFLQYKLHQELLNS